MRLVLAYVGVGAAKRPSPQVFCPTRSGFSLPLYQKEGARTVPGRRPAGPRCPRDKKTTGELMPRALAGGNVLHFVLDF
jgi:hypothetical protein